MKKMSLFRIDILLQGVILSLLLSPATLRAALPAAVDGESLPTLAPMLERATPAVVNIATFTSVRSANPLFDDPFFRRFFDLPAPRERRTRSAGSGVVVDAGEGYIVTNHHVIDGAEEIRITLEDGRTLAAQQVGSDPETDVAVIRVDPVKLTALPLADSERLRVGDFVVAIGNPFGLGQTVTSGIVSALGRSGLGIEGYEDFIQTDASINPGNSGGALVNLRGELVGINTAILSKSGGNVGIGFAIPINMVRQVMEQLVEHGRVERGRLGVSVQDLTPELASAFSLDHTGSGVIVAQVAVNSPADRSGLQVGDVIIEINGRRVEDAASLRNAVGLLRVGSEITLKILRDGKQIDLRARIDAGNGSNISGAALDRRLDGAEFASPNGNTDRRRRRIEGVVVASVKRNSEAATNGLLPGDLITSVNRMPTPDLETFSRTTSAIGRSPMLLNLVRGSEAKFLLLR